MMLLIMIIPHFMATILSSFLCVHIPFNQTLVFMGKVISSSETVFEGPYLFPINIISIIMFYKELNPLTKLFPPGD